MILIHGLSHESNMTEQEMGIVGQGVDRAKKQGVVFFPLASFVRRIDPVKDFLTLVSLFRIIKQEKPDIVHTHSSKGGALGRLAAKMAGAPVIIHTPHGHVFHGHFGSLASRVFLVAEKIFSLLDDCTVALTEGEKDDYINLSVEKEKKLVTIHSGVDIDHFRNVDIEVDLKKKELGLKPENRVVGTVGWLLPIKGPGHLLKAMDRVWKKYPDTELVYVGKGEMLETLQEEAVKMNADEKVKFLGWRDDVHEIIPVFDLFVLPSLNEGMGRVLVEAMALGKPVVGSDTGGIPDLIKQNETGLLVPPGDEEKLAEAIIDILGNPDKAEQMGSKGKVHCEDFSETAMVRKIDELYTDLMSR